MNKNKIGEFCGVNVVLSKDSYEEYKGTLNEQIEELQQRIDKAIEYIEQYEDRFKNRLASDLEFNVYEVLSILRGEDNE